MTKRDINELEKTKEYIQQAFNEEIGRIERMINYKKQKIHELTTPKLPLYVKEEAL